MNNSLYKRRLWFNLNKHTSLATEAHCLRTRESGINYVEYISDYQHELDQMFKNIETLQPRIRRFKGRRRR